jgi:hypothetical protein
MAPILSERPGLVKPTSLVALMCQVNQQLAYFDERISGHGQLTSPRKTQPREPSGPPAWLLERPYLRVPAAEVRP